MHSYLLASGALSFLIILAPIQETDKNRIDNPAGMTLVGLAFLLFLIIIGIKVRSRVKKDLGKTSLKVTHLVEALLRPRKTGIKSIPSSSPKDPSFTETSSKCLTLSPLI